MRQRFFPILLLAVMLASVVGCAATTAVDRLFGKEASIDGISDQSKVNGKPTLHIMWWGSQTRHERTLTVLDMYSAQKGIEFEPEFYGFDDYINKLNTLIAANDPPDMFQLGGNFPTYIDHIESLNQYITDRIIDTSDTEPGFIAITSLDGKTIGISSGTNSPAVAYDPEIFRRADVSEPDKNWTWAEFEEICMAIHERMGIYGFSQTENSEFEILTFYIQQYGTGESFFREPYRLELNYSDNKYVTDYLAMLYRLMKAGAYPTPEMMAEIKDVEVDPLVMGKSAMSFLYSNQFVAMTNAAGRPLKLVNVPRVNKNGLLGQSIQSSQMFCISRRSEHKMEAAYFLDYFINDIPANQVLQGERGVPIMKSVREALLSNNTPAEQEIYQYINGIRMEDPIDIMLNAPVQTDIRDAFIRIFEEVKYEKTTLEEAASRIKEEANDILSRYRETTAES